MSLLTHVAPSKEGKILTGVKDVDILILLHLNDDILRAVCIVNHYTVMVSNYIWRYKVELKYGVRVANSRLYHIMSYRKQYYSLPKFIPEYNIETVENQRRHYSRYYTKHGSNVPRFTPEYDIMRAAESGRLDAFIAHRNIWERDRYFYDILPILASHGYTHILNEIFQNYKKDPVRMTEIGRVIYIFSKKNDVGMLDLIYNSVFKNKRAEFPLRCVTLRGNNSNIILQWMIDNGIINVDTYFIPSNTRDDIRIINFLAKHNIFPTTAGIKPYLINFYPEALDILIIRGIKPDTETANAAAANGKFSTLMILEKHGILPNSRGANAALEYIYYRDKIRKFKALKWMYEREILPNDIIFVRIALNPRQIVIENPKNVEIYNWLKSSYEGLLN